MPFLQCLISALTQAGGGDLLFRFASSIQSCCGEGGALQADVPVCGEHSLCSGRAARSFGGLSPGTACLFPPWRAARAARGLAASPRARRPFSLQSQRAPPVGSQEVFRQEPGPVAGWEGVASLGLSLPLSPPPACYLQRGWGGSSLEFLSPFVLRTAGGVFRPVNFSLALPQLKKSPSDCSQGLRPVPTLRNAASSSPFHPLLLWRVRASGVLFCWELLLGT